MDMMSLYIFHVSFIFTKMFGNNPVTLRHTESGYLCSNPGTNPDQLCELAWIGHSSPKCPSLLRKIRMTKEMSVSDWHDA
jgi:hypothetical protein